MSHEEVIFLLVVIYVGLPILVPVLLWLLVFCVVGPVAVYNGISMNRAILARTRNQPTLKWCQACEEARVIKVGHRFCVGCEGLT